MKFASSALWITLSVTGFLMCTADTVRATVLIQSNDQLDELGKKLKDPDENVRRQAVEDLAALNKPEAWALVLTALADASPLVADTAQIRISVGADPERVKLIVGKGGLGAKEPLVRQRAAELLGRSGCEVDGALLAKLLVDPDVDVRRIMVHTIEILATAEKLSAASKPVLLKQFDQLFKADKDSDVRAAAIPARHALEPFEEDELMAVIRSKDFGMVIESANHTLADIKPDEYMEMVNKSVDHAGFSNLRTLIDVLVERADKSAAVSLANLIGRTQNRRAAWVAVDVLRDWSGKMNAVDDEFWKKWAAALPGDWKPEAAKHKAVAHTHPDGVRLMGQPVISRDLAILVDMTGWVNEKRPDGTLQKAQLLADLNTVISSFEEYSTFDIIPYAATAAPCDKRPVEVKPVSISHALNCVRGCNLTGRDDFLLAAQAAFTLMAPDTMLVITDSAPVGAHHVDPDLVAEEITQRNRFHRLVIDAILIHPDAAMEAAWRKVCSPSGGRVTKASF